MLKNQKQIELEDKENKEVKVREDEGKKRRQKAIRKNYYRLAILVLF